MISNDKLKERDSEHNHECKKCQTRQPESVGCDIDVAFTYTHSVHNKVNQQNVQLSHRR